MTGDSDDVGLWVDALTADVAPIGPAGDLFTAPVVDDPLDLLPDAPYQGELGLGLFGRLPLVHARARLPERLLPALDLPAPERQLRPPDGTGEVVTVAMGRQVLRVPTAPSGPAPTRASFLDLQEDPE